MITGGKITYAEIKRDKDEPATGLNINVSIDSVDVEAGELLIGYTYTVTYDPGVATLKISGVVRAKEADSGKLVEGWKKNKKLPDELAETLLNAINFTCGTNGTLIVRPLNLMPPMILPKISVGKTSAAVPTGKGSKGKAA